MSRVKAEFFVCLMCNRREEVKWTSFHDKPFAVLIRKLPDGWHGSVRKNGECLCRNCYGKMNYMVYEKGQ